MDISIFLAKVLGICLLVMSISLLLNAERYRNIFDDMTAGNPGLFFVSGFIMLVLGTLLVISHNVWVANWRVLITLFAWFTLLRGAARLAFPTFAAANLKRVTDNNTAYYVNAIVFLVVGAFLTYAGFMFVI